ncbi:MAG: 16S rRNA (cytidine(1402)-2'-O)-methyltransferase [Lachnospiraceae bacterium]|nr:16S rRNA (cytidine(1402)-2'-O)-methyltransferase [Lachnospiraceae bacterium]
MEELGRGKLMLVATPIGNLEDMTYRAVRVLQEADLIAAEDTRGSLKLLNHFDIHTPMTSYHQNNRIEKARVLVEKMLGGTTIALVTDAGTPGISDPGEDLVRMSLEAGIPVTSIPGACACITALTMSGQATRRFCFEAFLPPDKKPRQEVLEELKEETRTIVMYEAPHRLVRTLKELAQVLGSERPVTLCRELTKKHEENFVSTLGGLIERYETGDEPRGECVLVIAGRDRREMKLEQQQEWRRLSPGEHVRLYEEQGMDRKAAMKAAAKDRGVSKSDLYRQLLEENE